MELNYKIAIIGQGYVGLPLAISFSKFYDTIGYDKSLDRIDELNREHDSNLEVEVKANELGIPLLPELLEKDVFYIPMEYMNVGSLKAVAR